MKKHHLLSSILLLTLAACAGVEARESILMPTMSRAYSTLIARHVEAGIVAQLDQGEIDAIRAGELRDSSAAMQDALDSGIRSEVAALPWSDLRGLAREGVQARVARGEIGPGVGMSHYETINQFDLRHAQLLNR